MHLRSLVPQQIKSVFRERVQTIASELAPPLTALKYIPYEQGASSYILHRSRNGGTRPANAPLPVPPRDLWICYGETEAEYVGSGKVHVDNMLRVLADSNFTLTGRERVLDVGCGAGRMVRHLEAHAQSGGEVWGVDISAPHIFWAKQNLTPPFHFAVSTTIPHLPFEDRYFDLIYCGSLFTHIEELTETWLCELRRILSPSGRLYITIHDGHTIRYLDEKEPHHWLGQQMRAHEIYTRSRDTLGMLVIGRDTMSQVFYDLDYFARIAEAMRFRVRSVTEEAYGIQTAVLLERE